LHPFDIKAALLAKHAQHVVLIHFPIALFLAGVAFDFLARWKKQRLLAAAAYYNLFASALSTIPVLITGFLAWQWQLEGQRLKGILLMHLVAGCLSSALIWIVWLIHWRAQRQQAEVLPGYRLPLEAVAAGIVALTGHLGGFLSGVNVSS
jgi:uncharacterized membrane protein